jgi:hypothetical protein
LYSKEPALQHRFNEEILREVPNIDSLACLGNLMHVSEDIYRLLSCNRVAEPVLLNKINTVFEKIICLP